MLNTLDNIEVRVVNAEKEEEIPQAEILQDGKRTGAYVSGAFLEAAVQWNGWYMLFLTNNCDFEETLNIHLLDEHFHEMDSATMSWMYSTGAFKALELIQPRTVQFRFFGDTIWKVELLQKPSFRVPLLSEPAGVWRRWGFSRHFKVHGNPRPEKRTARRN